MSKALFVAIDRNDPDAVRAALKRVKNVNRAKNPDGYTAIEYACQGGHVAAVDALLDAGASADEHFVADHPIVFAADGGHVELVGRLAERMPPPPEAVESALFSALGRGDAAVATFLLDRFRPPITYADIVHAAGRGDPALLRLLAAHGGDPNARSAEPGGYGATPMHAAASNGSPGAVRALAAVGADVNARDRLGRTPLMVAVASLDVLLARDAFVAAAREVIGQPTTRDDVAGDNDPSGRAPVGDGADPRVAVLGATEPAEPKGTIETLLELGADASLTDADGNDVLMHYAYEAARSGKVPAPAVVGLLRRAGAPGAGPTGDLFAAVRAKDVAAVRAAITAGADVNRIGPAPIRATPLTAAAYGGSPELLTALLDGGADPNRHDGGETPLIRAAVGGNLAGVKVLIAAGADPHAQELTSPTGEDDGPRRNALLAAEWNRKFEVVDYLRSIGADRPKPATTWKPAEPGIAWLDDFDELHVKADVPAVAAALARLTGAAVVPDAYGKAFPPGRRTFVVLRAKGLACAQVLPLARRDREDAARDDLAARLAAACGAPAFTAGYSGTSAAAAFTRFDPDGSRQADDGWDYDSLSEIVAAMEDSGEPVPDHLRRRLATFDPDAPEPDSVERLRAVAVAEGFAFGLCWINVEPGRPIEVSFPDRPAEAFDAVAYVG